MFRLNIPHMERVSHHGSHFMRKESTRGLRSTLRQHSYLGMKVWIYSSTRLYHSFEVKDKLKGLTLLTSLDWINYAWDLCSMYTVGGASPCILCSALWEKEIQTTTAVTGPLVGHVFPPSHSRLISICRVTKEVYKCVH